MWPLNRIKTVAPVPALIFVVLGCRVHETASVVAPVGSYAPNGVFGAAGQDAVAAFDAAASCPLLSGQWGSTPCQSGSSAIQGQH